MKIFSAKSYKYWLFALAASVLPFSFASADDKQLEDIKNIAKNTVIEIPEENLLNAKQLKSMLDFEGFELLISRYFSTQQAYYLMIGAVQTDFLLDGLSQNSYESLGVLGLPEAIKYNIDGFQLLIKNGSGNSKYAKNFANILRNETEYFIGLVTAIIAGDIVAEELIIAEWKKLPRAYGHYFSEFQPDAKNLEKRVSRLARKMRKKQIKMAKALAASFTGAGDVKDATKYFQKALALSNRIIYISVPRQSF